MWASMHKWYPLAWNAYLEHFKSADIPRVAATREWNNVICQKPTQLLLGLCVLKYLAAFLIQIDLWKGESKDTRGAGGLWRR